LSLSRSTFYDAPAAAHLDDAEIVSRVQMICDEFEAYGYCRVGAELGHQGVVVNRRKIRRLMSERDLQPKRRRRYVATTDSDRDSLIFCARDEGDQGAEDRLGRLVRGPAVTIPLDA
jgi:putative transposase